MKLLNFKTTKSNMENSLSGNNGRFLKEIIKELVSLKT